MMTGGIELTARELDLNEFVRNATWRELLVELVETNRLDPWDIDIAKVVDSYVSAVRKMQVMDLHIPANIILAASILLRMKSETISILQLEEEMQPFEELGRAARIMPDIPILVPRARMQPKRRITLAELMDALGDAIKINEKRETIVRERAAPISMAIEKDDIDEKMRAVHALVRQNIDSEGVTTFSALCRSFETAERRLLALFVPLLFLAHSGEITLMQDGFFNEIFVRIGEQDAGKAK